MTQNKRNKEEKKPVFDDIGGYSYQKREAMKITNFFKNYEKFTKKGARLPKGGIFYGEPGTGKTMFALAIANESNVPLFKLTTDEFFKDESISVAIKKIFADAKAAAPSIIIIDELDRMVNCERGYARNESDKQREVLRILLTEIDDANSSGVFVIATANTDINFIPPALVRNGRLEKHIEIDVPTKEDRLSILNIYLKQNEIFSNISAEDVAAYTSTFTGAALSTLVNDVLVSCIDENKKATFNDFLEPIEVIKSLGIKKKSSDNNDPTIYHEIGHFIVDYALTKKIGMINVVPYGRSSGRFSRLEVDETIQESHNKSKTDLINNCKVAIAGLVATEVFLGEPFAGASDDIDKVLSTYVCMIKNGMLSSAEIAIQGLSALDYSSPYSDTESVTCKLFAEFLDQIKEDVRKIIVENKDLVERLYKELKAKSVLTHLEIEEIVKEMKK